MWPTWGITQKYAKHLYISVALPRVLYAADVWCTPTSGEHPGPKAVGSAKVTKQIASIQRAGALAITGGLRSSPTEAPAIQTDQLEDHGHNQEAQRSTPQPRQNIQFRREKGGENPLICTQPIQDRHTSVPSQHPSRQGSLGARGGKRQRRNTSVFGRLSARR